MTARRHGLFVAAILGTAIAFAGSARSAPPPPQAKADKIDPSGTWTWVRELEGETNRSVLKLSYKDGKLTGTYKRMGQTVPITNGKFDHAEISFDTQGTFNDQKIQGRFKGKISKDSITGTIEITLGDNSLPLPWEAKRGADPDDVVGTWKLKVTLEDGNDFEPELKLVADGDKLKGNLTSPFGDAEAKEIKIDGADFSWKIDIDRDGQKIKSQYKGRLDGNRIKGKVDYDLNGQSGSLDFTGERETAKKDVAKKPQPAQGPAQKTTGKRDPAR